MNNHTHDGSQYDLAFMRGRLEFLGSSGHQNAATLVEFPDLAEQLFRIPAEVRDYTGDINNGAFRD